MEYKSWMDVPYSVGETLHQLDPLSLVPHEGQVVALYVVIGITKEAALEISTPWRLSQVRKERDRLIAETDWLVLPDRQPTEAQLAYRQALRDITENFDPEAEVVFPSKP